MAEEHGFQPPQSHRRCMNKCVFSDGAAVQNMCSECHGDRRREKSGGGPPLLSMACLNAAAQPSTSTAVEAATEVDQPPSRCFACRKKVGLMGFRCRCGTTFCWTHRYPEKHGCSFDFKVVGKEAIAKANPVIKAAKLVKL